MCYTTIWGTGGRGKRRQGVNGIAFPTLSTKQLASLSFLMNVFVRADEHGKTARPFPEELEPG